MSDLFIHSDEFSEEESNEESHVKMPAVHIKQQTTSSSSSNSSGSKHRARRSPSPPNEESSSSNEKPSKRTKTEEIEVTDVIEGNEVNEDDEVIDVDVMDSKEQQLLILFMDAQAKAASNPNDANLQTTFDFYSAQYAILKQQQASKVEDTSDLTDPIVLCREVKEEDIIEGNDGLSEYNSKVAQIVFGDLSNQPAKVLPSELNQLVIAMKFLGMVMQDAWLIYSLALVKANQNECPDVMKAIAASVALAAQR
jgi:hypothetical protein